MSVTLFLLRAVIGSIIGASVLRTLHLLEVFPDEYIANLAAAIVTKPPREVLFWSQVTFAIAAGGISIAAYELLIHRLREQKLGKSVFLYINKTFNRVRVWLREMSRRPDYLADLIFCGRERMTLAEISERWSQILESRPDKPRSSDILQFFWKSFWRGRLGTSIIDYRAMPNVGRDLTDSLEEALTEQSDLIEFRQHLDMDRYLDWMEQHKQPINLGLASTIRDQERFCLLMSGVRYDTDPFGEEVFLKRAAITRAAFSTWIRTTEILPARWLVWCVGSRRQNLSKGRKQERENSLTVNTLQASNDQEVVKTRRLETTESSPSTVSNGGAMTSTTAPLSRPITGNLTRASSPATTEVEADVFKQLEREFGFPIRRNVKLENSTIHGVGERLTEVFLFHVKFKPSFASDPEIESLIVSSSAWLSFVKEYYNTERAIQDVNAVLVIASDSLSLMDRVHAANAVFGNKLDLIKVYAMSALALPSAFLDDEQAN